MTTPNDGGPIHDGDEQMPDDTNAQMIAALRPIVAFLDHWEKNGANRRKPDTASVYEWNEETLTAGMLRAARTALIAATEDGK
jgi:hypothetical protein